MCWRKILHAVIHWSLYTFQLILNGKTRTTCSCLCNHNIGSMDSGFMCFMVCTLGWKIFLNQNCSFFVSQFWQYVLAGNNLSYKGSHLLWARELQRKWQFSLLIMLQLYIPMCLHAVRMPLNIKWQVDWWYILSVSNIWYGLWKLCLYVHTLFMASPSN